MAELKVRVHPLVLALRGIVDRRRSKPPSGAEGHIVFHQVLAVLDRQASAGEALENVRRTRDPSENDSAYTKRIGLAAEQFGKSVTAALNRVIKITGEWERDVAARILTKTNLIPDGYASEVRAVFRGKSPTDQMRLLKELVDQNRGPELAAILKAPASLSGLAEDHRQRWELAMIARYAPDELAEKAALDDAFADALVVTQTAGKLAEAYADPVKLAEITKAEAAAAAATQAFDAKVSA